MRKPPPSTSKPDPVLGGPQPLYPARFLGELLAGRRRQLGGSQRDLADAVCAHTGRATVTRHEIARYEHEARIPAGPMLRVLTDVLRLSTPVALQAATLSRHRRRLAHDGIETVQPGYLLGTTHPLTAQPMLLIGVEAAGVSR